MHRTPLAGIAGILVAATAAVSSAAVINVPGGSFETPVQATGTFSFGAPNFGVVAANGSTDVGIQNIGDFSGTAGVPAATPGATDGKQAVFLGNGQAPISIFQDLTGAGSAGAASYTLTVALASRGGTASAGASFAGANVGLQDVTSGAAPVVTFVPLTALQTGTTPNAPSLGYSNYSVTLPATGIAAGDTLRVFLDKLDGTPLLLADNFRLASAVPEPASLGLLGLGGLTLLRRRRSA